jgi:hypothetical protein
MRRRRTWVWAVLLLLVCVGAVAAGLGALAKQEPEFYTRGGIATPEPDDPYRASDVQTRFSDLRKTVFTEPEWGGTFTQDDLNAFFREDPAMNNLIEPRLGGLTAPRVLIEGDRVRFAARYGRGFWSSVVTIEMRAWVIAGEPNLFALELLSLKAGALPLTKQMLMDLFADLFTADNFATVTWFRNGNNQVAVCRWLPNQSRPSTLLQTLKISDGQIEIGGRNLTNR